MNISQFDILGRLGQGSFGTVYKARRKDDRELCVLKQISLKKLTQKQK